MRWSRVAGIAGVAVMVSAGLTGAQSQAAPPSPDRVSPCVSDDSVIQARGGPREPDLGQVAQDLPAAAKGQAKPGFKATVPVYFHVITDGTVGSLTTTQIAAQIDVLNNTYAGGEGGAKTGFSFRLAGVTRTDNAAWFDAGPGGTDEHSMKRALHTGGPVT